MQRLEHLQTVVRVIDLPKATSNKFTNLKVSHQNLASGTSCPAAKFNPMHTTDSSVYAEKMIDATCCALIDNVCLSVCLYVILITYSLARSTLFLSNTLEPSNMGCLQLQCSCV